MADLGDILFRGVSLWLRLVGNTTTTKKFLRQTGTGAASAAPAWDTVADADLSVTDITTNNVTISAHGFTPKAPNDTTKFLRGDATWTTVPGAGGGNALLDAGSHTDTTASAVTKGDLIVGNSTPAWDDLAVGTDGHVLTADSAEAVGMKWAVASGGGDTYVRKTADETVNNNNTPQNDDELFFPVAASSVYAFTAVLILEATGTAADWKVGFTGPAGATMNWGWHGEGSTQFAGGNPSGAATVLHTLATVGDGGSVSGVHGRIIEGWVETAGTSGTVTLQWSQNTLTVADSKMKKNSYIRYRDMT